MKTNNGKSKSSPGLEETIKSIPSIALRHGLAKSLVVGLLMTAVIGYVFYSYVIAPRVDANESASQALSDQLKQNEAARAVSRSRPQFNIEFVKNLKIYRQSRELVPSEVEVSRVFDAVQELAAKDRCRVVGFNGTRPGEKSQLADNKLNEREVIARIEGEHSSIVQLMNDLAGFPRIIHVRRIRLIGGGVETAELDLIAYYSPDPADLPAVPSDIRAAAGEIAENRSN